MVNDEVMKCWPIRDVDKLLFRRAKGTCTRHAAPFDASLRHLKQHVGFILLQAVIDGFDAGQNSMPGMIKILALANMLPTVISEALKALR